MGNGVIDGAVAAAGAAEEGETGAGGWGCEGEGAAFRNRGVGQEAVVGGVVGRHRVLPVWVALIHKCLTGMRQAEVLVGGAPETLLEPGAVTQARPASLRSGQTVGHRGQSAAFNHDIERVTVWGKRHRVEVGARTSDE